MRSVAPKAIDENRVNYEDNDFAEEITTVYNHDDTGNIDSLTRSNEIYSPKEMTLYITSRLCVVRHIADARNPISFQSELQSRAGLGTGCRRLLRVPPLIPPVHEFPRFHEAGHRPRDLSRSSCATSLSLFRPLSPIISWNVSFSRYARSIRQHGHISYCIRDLSGYLAV